ncbi:MAG: cupin domain-containing protein [Terriglobia bacterium]|jgi:mannose-6-phosphate isomerase-like protein (cupin superfamily)
MKRIVFLVSAGSVALMGVAGLALFSEEPKPQPLTLPLDCPSGYCTLLQGVPQTAGMRSGLVRLKPAESIGEHTTGKNEESLVVIRGRGEAHIEGHPAVPFTAPALVYIPSDSRHDVVNTGTELLEYVYVVAPTPAH